MIGCRNGGRKEKMSIITYKDWEKGVVATMHLDC